MSGKLTVKNEREIGGFSWRCEIGGATHAQEHHGYAITRGAARRAALTHLEEQHLVMPPMPSWPGARS